MSRSSSADRTKKPPLKGVFLYGSGHERGLDEDMVKKFESENYLIIGDGIRDLQPDEIKRKIEAAGGVDSSTQFFIQGHGSIKKNLKSIKDRILDKFGKADRIHDCRILPRTPTSRTADILTLVGDIAKAPVEVHILSCYGGSAARDANSLPAGSCLICHGTENQVTSTSINTKIIDRLVEQRIKNPVTDGKLDYARVLDDIPKGVAQKCFVGISGVSGTVGHRMKYKDLLDPRKIVSITQNFIGKIHNKVKSLGADPRINIPAVAPAPNVWGDVQTIQDDHFFHNSIVGKDKYIKFLQKEGGHPQLSQVITKAIDNRRIVSNPKILNALRFLGFKPSKIIGNDSLIKAITKSRQRRASDITSIVDFASTSESKDRILDEQCGRDDAGRNALNHLLSRSLSNGEHLAQTISDSFGQERFKRMIDNPERPLAFELRGEDKFEQQFALLQKIAKIADVDFKALLSRQNEVGENILDSLIQSNDSTSINLLGSKVRLGDLCTRNTLTNITKDTSSEVIDILASTIPKDKIQDSLKACVPEIIKDFKRGDFSRIDQLEKICSRSGVNFGKIFSAEEAQSLVSNIPGDTSAKEDLQKQIGLLKKIANSKSLAISFNELIRSEDGEGKNLVQRIIKNSASYIEKNNESTANLLFSELGKETISHMLINGSEKAIFTAASERRCDKALMVTKSLCEKCEISFKDQLLAKDINGKTILQIAAESSPKNASACLAILKISKEHGLKTRDLLSNAFTSLRGGASQKDFLESILQQKNSAGLSIIKAAQPDDKALKILANIGNVYQKLGGEIEEISGYRRIVPIMEAANEKAQERVREEQEGRSFVSRMIGAFSSKAPRVKNELPSKPGAMQTRTRPMGRV